MTLIKSISGLRGTIGGKAGETLSPLDVVKFTTGYGGWILQNHKTAKVVIGRDARPSGEMYAKFVAQTLNTLGIEVVDLGLSTTPTVEMAVVAEEAQGGIILTASHNPSGWNALKLLNDQGEFISAEEGEIVLELAESDDVEFVEPKKFATTTENHTYIDWHIEQVLAHDLVDVEAIKTKGFKVVVDAVNSTGGIAVPRLLGKLGVEYHPMFCEPNGIFPHNPEPVPENLRQICSELETGSYDLGIVVDPDVDRLALVCEDGEPFGEEYTLVAVADYVLSQKKGSSVSNLSSTRALRDVTEKNGGEYYASSVGEVNVVAQMKAVNAVIGGEGNGGVIVPDFHYGRDALIGIALFLSHLAKSDISATRLRASYPSYFISKNKIELSEDLNLNGILESIKKKYTSNPINSIDGVKIEFDKEWVHLRKSNTEPIIRIFAESDSLSKANHLAQKLIMDIKETISS
ncbi:MAG: phosphoglucosamine mutase [Cytophagales bacterium]|nr:phosphoglucosamine mutase [Cytophagales bacterium]